MGRVFKMATEDYIKEHMSDKKTYKALSNHLRTYGFDGVLADGFTLMCTPKTMVMYKGYVTCSSDITTKEHIGYVDPNEKVNLQDLRLEVSNG